MATFSHHTFKKKEQVKIYILILSLESYCLPIEKKSFAKSGPIKNQCLSERLNWVNIFQPIKTVEQLSTTLFAERNQKKN